MSTRRTPARRAEAAAWRLFLARLDAVDLAPRGACAPAALVAHVGRVVAVLDAATALAQALAELGEADDGPARRARRLARWLATPGGTPGALPDRSAT